MRKCSDSSRLKKAPPAVYPAFMPTGASWVIVSPIRLITTATVPPKIGISPGRESHTSGRVPPIGVSWMEARARTETLSAKRVRIYYRPGCSHLYRFSQRYSNSTRPGLIAKEREVYTTPSRFNMMSMTAKRIRIWIQLPVRGNLGLMFPPKKPSSHSITRITMIVHNMRFLLYRLSYLKLLLPPIMRKMRISSTAPTNAIRIDSRLIPEIPASI